MECKYCGHIFPKEEKQEIEILIEDFEMVTKDIIVQKEINFSKSRGFKEYHSFFQVMKKLAKSYKPEIKDHAFEKLHEKAKKWHNHYGRHYTANRKKFTEERFNEIIYKL